MAGYEPKGKIDPETNDLPKHTCVHEDRTHLCHCPIGGDHTFEKWIDLYNSMHPADTAGDR